MIEIASICVAMFPSFHYVSPSLSLSLTSFPSLSRPTHPPLFEFQVLETLPHIKVILMSATAHTALYEGYFNVRDETIFVGVRRFPQQFFYCDELFNMIPSKDV